MTALTDGRFDSSLGPPDWIKIENLHSLESINTETSDTHGRSVWVHSSRVSFFDNSVPHNSLPDRVGPLVTGGVGSLCTVTVERDPLHRVRAMAPHLT